MLPGLDGTGELFRPLLDVMPRDLRTRVVAYPTQRALSYADLLGVIEAQLRDERDAVLVAESFSGPLALWYAAAHADRVRAVILCASFVRPPLPRWLRRFCVPVLFRVPPTGMAIRRLMVGGDATEPLVRAVKEAIKQVSPGVMAGRLREIMGVDAVAALRDCRAPLLYLAATNDALVGRRGVDGVRAVRPDVRVRYVEGPHLLLQREPVRAWAEIRQFLNRLPAGGSMVA